MQVAAVKKLLTQCLGNILGIGQKGSPSGIDRDVLDLFPIFATKRRIRFMIATT